MPREKKNHPLEAPETQQESAAERRERNKKSRRDARERSHRVRSIAFALAVILLLGVIASMVAAQLLPENGIFSVPRKIIATVMRPVQEAFSNGSGWFFDYVERLKIRNNIEYEYEQLYRAYDDLMSEVMLLKELQNELDEYSDLMSEMQIHSQFDGVPARVIATDSTNYFSTLQINVGSNQGIENYMAVVKSGGLVGYTYDVTPTTAKVQTIINSDTSIPAMIESTRYQGTVKGTMSINGEPSCRMYYLSENHMPRQGDRVVTSGVGVEFPKGIPIGYVRESTRGMEEGKSYVVIEPIVDFERIEYVIVYRYVPTYAEQAEERDDSSIVYTGLPTARPVPTFMNDGGDGFGITATPAAGSAAATPTPTAAPTPGADTPVPQDSGPTPTPTVANLSYDDIPGTPTPVPTPTPTATPTPTPTFSLTQLTDEGGD
ncbi:MAG: rod shape-determining protein MreC [Clostridia bacterium]|nr:rod shape-determining protein MreC [Clostridia bacterium]